MPEGNASTPLAYKLAMPVLCAIGMSLSVGCKSTGSSGTKVRSYDWSSLEKKLESGSTATPRHSLSRYEYPFDASGKYISSWAAEGERRLGRSAYAGSGSGSSTRSKSSASASSRSKPTPKKPSYRYHKVRAGDTLYGLSRRYGTTVAKIKSVNGLSSDLIVNGRTLKIP